MPRTNSLSMAASASVASLALGTSVLIGAGLAGRSGDLPELSVAEPRTVEPGRADGLSLGTAEILLPPTTPSRPQPDPVVVLGDEIVAGPAVDDPIDEPAAPPVRVRTPATTAPPAPTAAPPTTAPPTTAPQPPAPRPPVTTPPPTTAGPAAPPTTVDAHGEVPGKGLGHVKAKGKGHQKHHDG